MVVTSKVFKTKFLPSNPKIAFNQRGDGDLIIFIHGIGGNKENWHENMEAISKNFKTVSLDLRGYGESDDFEGPMNFFDIADDIYKLILYLGKKSVMLLAYQWVHKSHFIFFKDILA